jgi:hypothetical protein
LWIDSCYISITHPELIVVLSTWKNFLEGFTFHLSFPSSTLSQTPEIFPRISSSRELREKPREKRERLRIRHIPQESVENHPSNVENNIDCIIPEKCSPQHNSRSITSLCWCHACVRFFSLHRSLSGTETRLLDILLARRKST